METGIHNLSQYNEEDVKFTYKILNHSKQTEIRLIHPEKKKTPQSIFVSNITEFLSATRKYNGQYNLYVGIHERQNQGTDEKTVIASSCFIIDIDPVRQNTSQQEPSTEKELLKAQEVADKIVRYVQEKENKTPIIAMSGNGIQLWFPLPTTTFVDSKHKKSYFNNYAELTELLQTHFSTKDVKIDNISDAPRIIKIIGTLSIKGKNCEERPHRVSRFLNKPEQVETFEKLRDKLNKPVEENITEHFVIPQFVTDDTYPPCIKHVLYDHKQTGPSGWLRTVSFLAQFFQTIGKTEDDTTQVIIEWCRKQPYRENNEEEIALGIITNVYKKKLLSPNCTKIRDENTGFPHLGLKELGFCKPDTFCTKITNPVTYPLKKSFAVSRHVSFDEKKYFREKIFADRASRNKSGYYEFAKFIIEKNPLICWEDTEDLCFYHNGVYVKGGEVFVKKMVEDVLEDLTQNEACAEIIGHVKRLAYKTRDYGVAPKHFLCLNNGIFNIFTKELYPFDPNMVFINKHPVDFDPLKTCDGWISWLKQVVDETNISVVQELFGYALYRDHQVQKAFMLVGNGGNGKSTFCTVLTRFLGHQNVSNISMQELEEHRFVRAELFGKNANIYADLPSKSMTATSVFKSLTGGDEVTGEEKCKSRFKFRNYAKQVFSCNQIPMSYDQSDAYFRRWVILNFPNSFVGKSNPLIVQTMTTADYLSGILNWALEGLYRLLSQNELSNNQTLEEVREKYVRLSDSVQCFNNDMIEEDWDSCIVNETLFLVYLEYCRKEKMKPLDSNLFFKRLKQLRKCWDKRLDLGKERIRVLCNIKPKKQKNEDLKNVLNVSSGTSVITCFFQSVEHQRILVYGTLIDLSTLNQGKNVVGKSPYSKNDLKMADVTDSLDVVSEPSTNEEKLRLFFNSCKQLLLTDEVSFDVLTKKFGDDLIADAQIKGIIFESKRGFYKLL